MPAYPQIFNENVFLEGSIQFRGVDLAEDCHAYSTRRRWTQIATMHTTMVRTYVNASSQVQARSFRSARIGVGRRMNLSYSYFVFGLQRKRANVETIVSPSAKGRNAQEGVGQEGVGSVCSIQTHTDTPTTHTNTG